MAISRKDIPCVRPERGLRLKRRWRVAKRCPVTDVVHHVELSDDERVDAGVELQLFPNEELLRAG